MRSHPAEPQRWSEFPGGKQDVLTTDQRGKDLEEGMAFSRNGGGAGGAWAAGFVGKERGKFSIRPIPGAWSSL